MNEEIIYISGPMSGIDKMNYPKFYNIERQLKERGAKVYNPARIAETLTPVERDLVADTLNLRESIRCDHSRDWLSYIIHEIPYVFRSTAILMLEGWETSDGAQIEKIVAEKLDLNVFYEHEVLG